MLTQFTFKALVHTLHNLQKFEVSGTDYKATRRKFRKELKASGYSITEFTEHQSHIYFTTTDTTPGAPQGIVYYFDLH